MTYLVLTVMLFIYQKETDDKQIWMEGYKEWLDKREEEPEMWEHIVMKKDEQVKVNLVTGVER